MNNRVYAGCSTTPEGPHEYLWQELERKVVFKFGENLIDGRPRCVEMRRSTEANEFNAQTLSVELIWGFLNTADAEIGDYVHHVGMLAATQMAHTQRQLCLQTENNHRAYFQRFSEIWWIRND